MEEIIDHPYTGELRRGASCQHHYPAPEGRNPDVCGQQAMIHATIPDPAPTPELTGVQLRGHVQTYWFTVTGQDPLPAVRNPNGVTFLPDSVTVEWRDGVLDVTVQGLRINAQGKPLKRSRLFTSYDQNDITNGEMPGWVVGVVQMAVDAHSSDYWARVTAGLPRKPAFAAPAVSAPDCTHGADCTVHPDANGIHNFDATAAEVLEAVLAAVSIRHKFDADDVRDIAAQHGVELRH